MTHILLGGYAPFASSRPEKLFRLIKKGRVTFEDVSDFCPLVFWRRNVEVTLIRVPTSLTPVEV